MMVMMLAVSLLVDTLNHIVLPISQLCITEMFPVHRSVMKFVETTGVARLFGTLLSSIPVCGASPRLLDARPVRTTAKRFAGTSRAGIMIENLSPVWAVYARI